MGFEKCFKMAKAPKVCNNKTRIFLVGFMGAGKSTVGRGLALRLNWEFVDLDAVIEKQEGRTIREIFNEQGEEHFRALETWALQQCALYQCAVIALGGGAFVNRRNRKLVQDLGESIFLDCPFEVIFERCAGDQTRPLFQKQQQVHELYERRQPFYRMSDWRLNVDRLSADEIVEKVLVHFHTSLDRPVPESSVE
jgi:shikimate kinase